jgi:hypothetical protein
MRILDKSVIVARYVNRDVDEPQCGAAIEAEHANSAGASALGRQ